MVKHGFRLVVGSWKIIAMSLPTRRRRSRSEMPSRSLPAKRKVLARTRPGKAISPISGHHGHALAGAGFADDAQHLAFFQRQAHAFDRAHHAALRRELDVQVFDFEKWCGHG